MRKLLFIVWFMTLSSTIANAQTVYTGINTKVPGSTLDVNGSFAAAYFSVTANAYNASETDFSIKWAGTAAGTITLPASASGPDRSGRIYFVKNASTSFALTVKGNGSELIDNSNTVVVDPGEALLIAKTDNNTASGGTYIILQISNTLESYSYSISWATSQNIAGGAQGKLDFTTIDYSTNGGGDFNVTTDTWTCPQSGWYSLSVNVQAVSQTAADTHSTVIIKKNNLGIGAQRYFYVPGSPLINSGSVDKTLKLIQGDQITAFAQPCLGCSAGGAFSGKLLDINRL